MFKGKTILITGGTGFLGQSLIKYFLTQKVHSIRIFSRDEVKHYRVQQKFEDNQKLRFLIGDVRDYERVKKAMQNVDIVIHAAALKRIDMMEYNVEEVIKTDIQGSLNVARAALECNVKKAILVSTDKACHPITTYGACKFVAERIFTEMNYNKGSAKTIFTTVRYGNVLNSTGSVIPFFKSRIKSGKTIPLTDPNMTRFIITDEEAVQLIVEAIQYGVGGEVFIPQLPAFKINDLIEIMKEKYNSKVKIQVIGIRVNEKYHELMINKSEMSHVYKYRNVFVIRSPLIDKYQPKASRPIYVSDGIKVNDNVFEEYCSKDVVVHDRKKLAKILEGII